ncbi:hypothetical protein EW146_g127 [Bondarzewia mesenterica]|uniref:Septin-type G domain-containing protein n=1 Tax=Bondarzewia mesenterica TaxID=1095465 RepID=A0A4S4ME86_9AGAM|nr:hypothetical protein EW146_g127 [Bondarzewia mesenterica]
MPLESINTTSQPSSPRSSALPSPPDSPDSISSFPSLSSSFFFSSAAASPPHSHSHLDQDRGSTHSLIIPSLTLPSALRPPTPYGKTLGEVRLLILGGEISGSSSLSSMLLESNEDVVDVGMSEPTENGFVQRASTDWIEHRDAHGLEKFEPSNNIEILELPGYNLNLDLDSVVQSIRSIVHGPFDDIARVIDPHCSPSTLLSNLIASPSTPLYTALIVFTPTLSPRDRTIVEALSADIPIIILPPLPSQICPQLRLSSFHPVSALALCAGLFRSPEKLTLVRTEAADRFLRWREVERAVRTVHQARSTVLANQSPTPSHHISGTDPNLSYFTDVGETRDVDAKGDRWNKANWEAEWDSTLSRDVARRLREYTITSAPPALSHSSPSSSCIPAAFDPLHLPSLLVFSLSLFAPLKERIAQVQVTGGRLGFLIVGTLCAGIGIGLALR